MNTNIRKYGLPAIKSLITLAFIAAGLAKLAGAEMMVATFDAVGVGQWLRYVTGIFEVGGAILLWIPGKQLYGAALLAVTMTGAVLSHLFILGTATMPPAVLLLILSAVVAYTYRDQVRLA
jgi:uncharacterized membrane protein YphA (DoxX/SURF4 family)